MKKVKPIKVGSAMALDNKSGGDLVHVTELSADLDLSTSGVIGITFNGRGSARPITFALTPPAADLLRRELKKRLKEYRHSEDSDHD